MTPSGIKPATGLQHSQFAGWGVGQSAHMTDKNMLVLQSCTDAPRVEHGLCSDTNVQSSGDGSEVSIKIEVEEIRIKEEDEPEVSPQTFHVYLGLPFVIKMFCLTASPYKSTLYGKWKCSVYI